MKLLDIIGGPIMKDFPHRKNPTTCDCLGIYLIPVVLFVFSMRESLHVTFAKGLYYTVMRTP